MIRCFVGARARVVRRPDTIRDWDANRPPARPAELSDGFVSLLLGLAPPRQGVDGLPERGSALGEGVRKHVVGERNPVQDARCVQFPQPSGEDVGGCAEFALEVAVALCAVEEAADDQERPTLADEFERCGQAVPVVGRHPAGGPAGSVQNGAKWLPSGSSKCRWYMKP